MRRKEEGKAETVEGEKERALVRRRALGVRGEGKGCSGGNSVVSVEWWLCSESYYITTTPHSHLITTSNAKLTANTHSPTGLECYEELSNNFHDSCTSHLPIS